MTTSTTTASNTRVTVSCPHCYREVSSARLHWEHCPKVKTLDYDNHGHIVHVEFYE